MKKMSVHLIFAALLLSGCASAPMEHNVVSNKTALKSFDLVWQNLIAFFATNQIQIKTIAKDSGIIYAEYMMMNETQMSNLADCGVHGLWQPVQYIASLNVFVTKIGENKASIKANSNFQVIVQFGQARMTKQCNSLGTLEASILDSI